ncbi:MAG TPA: hypothetical protein ENI29_18050 [bacterium]|nr:hypothetical protein [bacterium]
MPVEITSYVVLALKKVNPEIENRELLENWVIARIESLFSKLGIAQINVRMFSIVDHDAKYWNRNYGVDVKDLVEDYTFVKGRVTFYDSGGREKPPPEEEDLLEDSFYRFFHNNYGESDKMIKLNGDKIILINSFIDSP